MKDEIQIKIKCFKDLLKLLGQHPFNNSDDDGYEDLYKYEQCNIIFIVKPILKLAGFKFKKKESGTNNRVDIITENNKLFIEVKSINDSNNEFNVDEIDKQDNKSIGLIKCCNSNSVGNKAYDGVGQLRCYFLEYKFKKETNYDNIIPVFTNGMRWIFFKNNFIGENDINEVQKIKDIKWRYLEKKNFANGKMITTDIVKREMIEEDINLCENGDLDCNKFDQLVDFLKTLV